LYLKKSLVFKLTLCYIIAISVFYAITNTIGSYYIKEILTEYEIKDMKITANNIKSSNKLDYYYANVLTLEELKTYILSISEVVSSNIWLLDSKGKIIIDSSGKISEKDNINITTYDNTILEKEYIDKLSLSSIMTEPCICSINKISKDKDTLGYIFLNLPYDNIETQYANFITKLNVLVLLICPVLIGIFVLIYFLTIYPVHKITKYTIEYSKGNFNYELKLNTNDEYKELADAITYMAGELYHLDEHQRKFISNISHDIRSPLTSIKGYVEAMLDGTIPIDNQEKYLKIILFESERLTELTSNLLTLNKLGNHTMTLDKALFDINYIIEKTIETYEGRCNDNEISLICNFETEKQHVYADKSQIQQVLNNLIDNAIKFSPKNSQIIVSTYLRTEKVFVSVKDSGEGIPKDSLTKIWERFYKIDPSRGKDKKGTGLGLAITKDIINAHNENINVVSTEGVGTEFVFTLPKSNG